MRDYTNKELTEIYCKANGIPEGKAPPITTEKIFVAMRAMLNLKDEDAAGADPVSKKKPIAPQVNMYQAMTVDQLDAYRSICGDNKFLLRAIEEIIRLRKEVETLERGKT